MNSKIKTTKIKWYQKPIRIAALQCESKGDSDSIVDVWYKMGFNVEQLLHISAEGYHGYFRKDRLDKIRNYIINAKRKGLRIIFYLGMTCPKEIRENQKWLCEDNRQNKIWPPCVNSPFREWFFKEVKKVAHLGIDGIFIDGPFFPQNACYCQYCKDNFKRIYKETPPVSADPTDKNWRNFVEFRYDSITRFVKDARASLKSIAPTAIIYTNGQALSPRVSTARDNRRVMPYQDMLGAEGGFIFYGIPGEVPWWKPGATARLLESQASGKPTVIFIAGDHKLWNRYLHTAAETKLLIADAVANGANPWYGIHSTIEDMKSPGGKVAGEMMQFLKDNESYYYKTESITDVAILWSSRTADYYCTEVEKTDFTSEKKNENNKPSYSSCFNGFIEMLIRLHIPFDIIDEKTLFEKRLSKYKIIILPNCAYLNDEEIIAIKKFVGIGGNLVSSFETSLYGNDFSRGTDFYLADVFGANLGSRIYNFHAASYMSLERKYFIFKGVSQTLLPSPTLGLEIKPNSAETIALFREPLSEQYFPVPKLTTPAILLNNYKNGKSIYLAGNFGESFKLYGIIDHLKIFGNILNWLSKPILTTQYLPETVEVVVRFQQKNQRLLIHLINFTGTMRRPISKIVKVTNSFIQIPESILVSTGIKPPIKVYTLISKNYLTVLKTKSNFTIKIPELNEYEVLVITGG